MTEELKNCPFCGGKAGLGRWGTIEYGGYRVGCEECSIYAPPYCGNVDWQIERWNTRPAIGQQSGWRSIESAPRDGTHILGAIFENKDIIYVRKTRWHDDSKRWAFFTPDGLSYDYSLHLSFTHWQPLPAPPEPNKQEG